MLREKELDVGLARCTDLGAIRVNDHAVKDVIVARGNKVLGALDLDHAHAATADLVQILEVAQRWNVDARRGSCLQDRRIGRNLENLIVDRDLYHWSILPPRNEPKPKWSHRRQRDASWRASSDESPCSTSSQSPVRSPASRSLSSQRPHL